MYEDLFNLGLKRVDPKPFQLNYATPTSQPNQPADFYLRAQPAMDLMNNLAPGGDLSKLSLSPVQFMQTDLQSDGVPLDETLKAWQRANPVTNPLANIIVYDTETFGTSRYASQGNPNSMGALDVGQLSLQKYTYGKNGELVGETPIVLSAQIASGNKKAMNNILGKLEKDANAWTQLSKDERRSAIDLILYSDASFFEKQTINGIEAVTMTGQPSGLPSVSASPFVIQDNLAKMKRGLENRSNPAFANPDEAIAQVVNSIVDEHSVWAGQNVQSFDRPVMLERFGHVMKGNKFGKSFNQSQLDALPLLRTSFARDPYYTGKNFTLSEVYKYIRPNSSGSNQAHFAGSDVSMTAEVLSHLISGESMPGGLLFNASETKYLPKGNNRFIATRGLPSYQPSRFNRNQNAFSYVLDYDAKRKGYVPSANYQESVSITNREYEFLGMKSDYEINGLTHHVLLFQDLERETISVIADSDKNRLMSIFSEGRLVPIDSVDPTELAYRRQDRARRAYDRMFSGSMRYDSDYSAKQITNAYSVLEEYDKLAVEYGGRPNSQQKDEIALKIFNRRNEYFKDNKKLTNKDGTPNYTQMSYGKIQNIVHLSDVLNEDKEVNLSIVEEAQRLYPVTTNSPTSAKQQQNIFIKSMHDQLQETLAIKDARAGYSGMKMMELQTSIKGEVNYIDVTSKVKHQSSLERLLGTNQQTPGQSLNKLEVYLNNISQDLPPEVRADIKAAAARDLQQNGRITQRTVQQISNQTFGATLHSQSLVGGIKVSGSTARIMGVAEGYKYANGLVSKESEFFKGVINQAKEMAMRHQGGRLANDIQLSGDILNQVTKTQTILEKMDQQVLASQKIHQLDQGQIKAAGAAHALRKLDIAGEIKKSVEMYESNGFNVGLYHDPNSNRSLFAFSFKESGVNFGNMSLDDIRNNKNIGMHTLPLMGDNLGIQTTSGSVAHRYRMDVNSYSTGSPIKMTSNVEDMFRDLRNTAKSMKEHYQNTQKFNTGETIQDVVSSGMSRYSTRARKGASFTAFGGVLSNDVVKQVFSPTKAFNESFIVNTDSMLENYMKLNDPHMYDRWSSSKTLGEFDSLFDANKFWRSEGVNQHSYLFKAALDFNANIGSEAGIQLSFGGLNATQIRHGQALLRDRRESLPFGKYSSTVREQIIKAENYRQIEADSIRQVYGNRISKELEAAGYRGEELRARVESEVQRRVGGDIQFGLKGIDDSLSPDDSRISAIRARQMQTNDAELYKLAKQSQKEIDEEISALRQLQLSQKGKSKQALQGEIDALVGMREEITQLSVYDGQSLMRESIAKGMRIKEQRAIALPANDQLPESLVKAVSDSMGVPYVKGMEIMGADGRFQFDNALDYEAMNKLGLIDKDGFFTVSQLVEAGTNQISDEMLSNKEVRITKGTRLTGLAKQGGVYSMLLDSDDSVETGMKTLGVTGEYRNTVRVVSDRILDRLGINADIVTESLGLDKNIYGTNMNTLFNTMFDNIADDLNRANFRGAQSLDDVTLLPGVREGLDSFIQSNNNKITLQDLSNASVIREAREYIFRDSIKEYGVGSQLQFDERTGLPLFNNVSFDDSLSGEIGQTNYRKVYNRATEKFGFSKDYVVMNTGIHNTVSWSGTGTKINESFREHIVQDMQLKVMFNSEESAIGRHLKAINRADANRDSMDKLLLPLNRAYDFLANDTDPHRTVNQKGNVIFDYSGRFAANESGNTFIDPDTGALIVDAQSMGRIDTKQASLKGTLGDAYSVELRNEELGINTTLGDYLQKNSENRAFIQTQHADDTRLSRTYLPVIPTLEDRSYGFEETHTGEINKANIRTANVAYEYNTMMTTGSLTVDEHTQRVEQLSQQFARGEANLESNLTRYHTSKQSGDATKLITSRQSKHGGNFVSQTRNQMNYMGDDALSMNVVEVNSSIFRRNIDGAERGILLANNYSEEILSNMSKSQMSDEIIKRMRNADKDPFNVYGQTVRYPIQGMGNIQIADYRLNDNLSDDVMNISPVLAELLRSDYDGDKLYSKFDMYREVRGGESLPAVQADLRYLSERINDIIPEGYTGSEDVFKALASGSAEAKKQFGDYYNNISYAQEYLVNYQKSSLIGQSDNMVTALRQAVVFHQDAMLREGLIDNQTYKNSLDQFDNQFDDFVQSFISAKKVTPQAMGFDYDEMSKLSGQEALDYTIGKVDNFINTYDDFSKNLLNLAESDVTGMVSTAQEMGWIKEADVANFQRVLEDTQYMVQNLNEMSPNVMQNAAFSIGKSQGDIQGRFADAIASGDVSDVLMTPLAQETAGAYKITSGTLSKLESQQYAALAQIEKGRRARTDIAGEFSDAIASQVADMADLSNSRRALNNSNLESVSDIFRDGFSEVTQSKSFQVGAGMAAVWLIGSAIKGGPTPEGNDAQQEATAYEVAPSAMLTSPTARVTPIGESVQLNISGAGNVPQSEIAGLVNQSIAMQTGVPMNMNVHTSDNVQKLDHKFYEDVISRTFGFN